MKKRISLIVFTLCFILSSVCSITASTGISEAKAKKISLNRKKITMIEGSKFTLKLKNAKIKKVKFKTNKPKIATVNKKGVITAKKAGSATITATYKKKKYKCSVKVTGVPTTQTTNTPDNIDFFNNSDDRINLHFSDELFATADPKEYNNELAKVSLALSMTPGEKSSEYDLPKLENMLRRLGFDDYRTNDEYNKTPTKDSIGVACANRFIMPENGKVAYVLLVVIRSQDYGDEWASNMTMGESGDHEGFSRAADKVISFIKDYINNEFTNNCIVWICGQSRGAAVGNLVAERLFNDDLIFSQRDKHFAYLFATPQAAYNRNNDNMNHGYETIHNVLYERDVVRQIPPSKFGFSMLGEQKTDIQKPEKEAKMEEVLAKLDTSTAQNYKNVKNAYPSDKTPTQYVTDCVKDLTELVGDRDTYVSKWQNTFIALMCTLFGNGVPEGIEADDCCMADLSDLLFKYNMNALTIDHYPSLEYAWLCVQ